MCKCVVSLLCLTLVSPGFLEGATVVPSQIQPQTQPNVAPGQGPAAALGLNGLPLAKTLKVESDTWMSILECFRSEAPGGCLQRRAFKALLNWAEGDETNEIPTGERKTDSDVEDREPKVEDSLPAGTPPAVGRIIDRLGDLIASSLAQFYPEPVGNDGNPTMDIANESEERSGNGLEQVRGHKKKVKKELKKLAIKILILLYVLQQAKKLILETIRTFAYVKFSLIAAMYVAIQGIKLWHWLKQKHHMKEHSAVLYEAGHPVPHHYPPEHHEIEYEHEEHHPIWGRRSVEGSRIVTPGAPAPAVPEGYATYYAEHDPHALAYAAQIPDRNYVKAR